MLATLGAFAVAFGVLYMEVTQATGRRKRSEPSLKSTVAEHFYSLLWSGRVFQFST